MVTTTATVNMSTSFMTWEEYLEFEEQSPYRHEYVNGAVYAMSGEILSKSTHQIDRREKAMMYQRVEAIEEYVLIAQCRPRVIVHRKAEGWRPVLYSAAEAQVEFRSIALQMPMMRIYESSLVGLDKSEA
jgi:Uma2 family endonuclease